MSVRTVVNDVLDSLEDIFDFFIDHLWLWFLFAVALMIACPNAHGQSWSDRRQLEAAADSASVDRNATLAIAWEESRANLSPRLRGHHCWYAVQLDGNDWELNEHETVVRRGSALWLLHREPNCEVGRFQIKPSTARARCPGLDVFTYRGNVKCFARMFAEDSRTHGRLWAIARHNGSGPMARAYRDRVLKTVGWLIMEGT